MTSMLLYHVLLLLCAKPDIRIKRKDCAGLH